MKPLDAKLFKNISGIQVRGNKKNDDIAMEIIEEGDPEKALNAKSKTQYVKQPQRTIYEVIENDYLNESKVKFPIESPIKCRAEFNVPQFIPHDVKKNIQQVGLENGLLSKTVKIKREVFVVVDKSTK